MAITITKQPSFVSALNEAVLVLKTDNIAGSFYKIYLIVNERLPDLSLREIGTDAVSPDAKGEAYFDLTVYLESLFQQNSYVHEFDGWTIRSEITKRYKLNYYYQYHDGQSLIKSELEGVFSSYGFSVLNSRLSQMQLKNNEKNGTCFLDTLSQKKAFLTNQPRTKLISKTQPERLYFLVHNSNHESFVLKTDILFADGSMLGDAFDFTYCGFGSAYAIRTGYYDMGLDKLDSPANFVIQYSVWLENEHGENISEKFTYIIDRRNFNNERYLIFQNYLGGFDCVRCTGQKKIDNTYKNTIVEGYNKEKTNTEHTETHTLNTGLISAKCNENLQEMFKSREAYELDGDKLYSVVIQNKKTKAWEDGLFLTSLDIEFERDIHSPVEVQNGNSGTVIGGIAEFACSLVNCEQMGDEIIIEVDVSNVSEYDGETFLTFDFDSPLLNGEDYELKDTRYFYYNEPVMDGLGYTRVDLSEGDNFIGLKSQERAVFVYFYIENTEPEGKKLYEAGRMVIVRDDVKGKLTVEHFHDTPYFAEKLAFSAVPDGSVLELNAHVLSPVGEMSFFYRTV